MIAKNAIVFNGTSYNVDTLNGLPSGELVKLYNQVAKEVDGNPVKRFADKSTAVSRTMKVLETFRGRKPAPKATKPAAGERKPATRAHRGTNLQPPGGAPVPCREGSKQAILLDTLAREKGATMEQLVSALSGGNKPWTEATVRSGFGWDMKLKGYGVRSEFVNGVERFYIVVPKGHSIPPHRPLKGAAATKH